MPRRQLLRQRLQPSINGKLSRGFARKARRARPREPQISSRCGHGLGDGYMAVDDGKHGGGQTKLGGNVEIRVRANQNLYRFKVTAERGKHESRLPIPI